MINSLSNDGNNNDTIENEVDTNLINSNDEAATTLIADANTIELNENHISNSANNDNSAITSNEIADTDCLEEENDEHSIATEAKEVMHESKDDNDVSKEIIPTSNEMPSDEIQESTLPLPKSPEKDTTRMLLNDIVTTQITTMPTENEIESSIVFENQCLDNQEQSNELMKEHHDVMIEEVKDDLHNDNTMSSSVLEQQASPNVLPIASPAPATVQSQETQINARDVLCGRGGGTNNHPGNRHFREVVSAYQPQYITSKKRDKKFIAAKVVEIIRESGGRFLQKINDVQWIDIGDKKAIEKTSQALREGMDVRHKKALQECHEAVLNQSLDGQHNRDLHADPMLSPSHTFIPSSIVAPHIAAAHAEHLLAKSLSHIDQQQHSFTVSSDLSAPQAVTSTEIASHATDVQAASCAATQEPVSMPPPPHICVICNLPETKQRPLCLFPPNLLIHAFCGTLAASPSYNKPQYELLHLKGIKHKYRNDDMMLKLLPAALSRTRSAVNKLNSTRLYMVRDLEMQMKELREMQQRNIAEANVHSQITVAGAGKRGRGRPRKGEIVLPKLKRPRGRPPKDSEIPIL